VSPAPSASEPSGEAGGPAPADAAPGAVGRLTLPSGSRVRRSSEVRRAFDRGRSAASGAVVVYAFDRGDGLPPRYGLVVGRKWGDAVTRNRIRRLLREGFRTCRPSLPPGMDLLLLPRGRLEGRRMPEVRRMLLRAAQEAARRVREAAAPADAPGETSG